MKKQKKKVIIFIFFLLVLIIFLFLSKKNLKKTFQDELIFFKLFSSHTSKKEEKQATILPKNQAYSFKVSYRNIDFKNIYLADTMKRDTLVREKIAPGTEGDFEIILQTNQRVNYRIEFKSTNEKPKNLYFKIEGKDRKYIQLEDMEKELKGEITESKSIKIHWKWDYETDKRQNFQDTKDGEMIRQYKFTIYAIGE